MSPFISQRKGIFVLAAIIGASLVAFLYYSSSSTTNVQSRSILQTIHRHEPLDNASSSPRICCLILTSPKDLLTRAEAINGTWAPRCDRYFFITEYPRQTMTQEQIRMADQLPIAPIPNIMIGYEHLTQKSNVALLFAYEHHRDDFDWFVKADDDTYLIVDHLRTFLSKQNASEPVTFGYNFKVHVPQGYHSGGASYVLSRESLRRFHEAHQDPQSSCQRDGGSEDLEVAKCLRTKGVYPGKSVDEQNRELFHPLPFISHFRGSFPDWLYGYAENAPQSGYACCSDQSISFHYVSPDELYLMDFLLYRVKSSVSGSAAIVRRFNTSTRPFERHLDE